ncbi:MAG TPA: vWA domain-containing protein, partial [Polyangiales bacterium]
VPVGSPPGATGGGGGMAGATDAGTSVIQNPATATDSGVAIIYDAGAGTNPNSCVATKASAPPASNPKIDIVWIVDTSGSMFGEQKLIKDNLGKFADRITSANLDVSIVMVSQSPTLIPGPIQVPGLCPELPPDPLAGTPLAMDPRYHFVRTTVDSPAPLNVAIQQYPMYSQFLRPGSVVHFIVVTDDESGYPGGNPTGRAMQFQTDMMARLGRPFRFHAIASPPGMRCNSPNCVPDPNNLICAFLDLTCQAAAGGDTYYTLAPMTQGLTASICEPDWTKIFSEFQDNIIKSAPLPCDYAIPPPPKGDTLDPNKVNVGYTAPAGAEEVFPRVNDGNACGQNPGWFYDDAKTKVLLCPAACTKASQGGAMNIAFGCNTVVLE